MSFEMQASLFGEGRMTPPQRSSAPDPVAIRGRLDTLLTTLRSAHAMPLSDRDARMWAAVVPNMTKWLPNADAEAVRAAFTREMERLRAAAIPHLGETDHGLPDEESQPERRQA